MGRRNISRFAQLFASLALLCCLSGFVLSQEKRSAEDQAKLNKAQKEAERFVERFRRTLDFATVWREFHSSNKKCVLESAFATPQYSHDGSAEKSLDERIKEMRVSDGLLERHHAAVWNFILMQMSMLYSISPPNAMGEPDIEHPDRKYRTKAVKMVFREIGLFVNAKDSVDNPQSSKDIEVSTRKLNRISALLRKTMPHNALNNANWHSAVQWFNEFIPYKGVRQKDPKSDYCIDREGPVYVAQIGTFVLAFIEENGKMKLLSMILPTQ